MKTVSNVIGSDRKIVTQSQKSFQSSATILNYLDVIAEKLGEIAAATNQTKTIEIIELNVALAVKYTKPVNLNVVGVETSTGNLSLAYTHLGNGTVLASAEIPEETFKNKSQIVYSFLFRNDMLFQTGKQLSALEAGDKLPIQVSSQVLAVSVGKGKVANLTSQVLFVFKKKIFPKDSKKFDNLCTFWDPTTRE